MKENTAKNVTISENEIAMLRERSLTLGIIAGYVEEFREEDETILMGVVRLLARYHEEAARNHCYIHTNMRRGLDA